MACEILPVACAQRTLEPSLMFLLQRSRYDKIQHVREAAVRALTELGAMHSTPAAAVTTKARLPRQRTSGAASSTGRGSAAHRSPSENTPPWLPSPRSAAGTATADFTRAPLASSSSNKPRFRRPADGGKLPSDLDFGVEVFAPPRTPPPAASCSSPEQPESVNTAERAPSPAAASATGEELHAAPSPEAPAESPQRQSLLPLGIGAAAEVSAELAESDRGHILGPPAAVDPVSSVVDVSGHRAAETLGRAADNHEEPSPDVASKSHTVAAAASADGQPAHPPQSSPSDAAYEAVKTGAEQEDLIEHRSGDGITVRMRPSASELDLQLLDGYAGCGTFLLLKHRFMPPCCHDLRNALSCIVDELPRVLSAWLTLVNRFACISSLLTWFLMPRSCCLQTRDQKSAGQLHGHAHGTRVEEPKHAA